MDGKVLPNNLYCEKELLGYVMYEPECVHKLSVILTPDVFYRAQHILIWGAILQLTEVNQEIDLTSLTRILGDKVESYYVSQLMNLSPNLIPYTSHALYLKELYFRRKLIIMCHEVSEKCFDLSEDIFDEMSRIQAELDLITNEISKIQEVNFCDQVAERVFELKEAAQNNYKTGVVAHFDTLDRHTNGFQPTDLILVAARPGMGKTSIAVDFARKQAKNGIPVAFFSLEMSAPQLIDKMLSQESDIDLIKLRKGGLNGYEWQRFDEKAGQVAGYPFYVWDKGGTTLSELRATLKLWKLKYGIKIAYVDYMQLIEVGKTGKNQNREQDISLISRTLKALAKNLKIPIVCLSQLSRRPEERGDKKPILSDLRESGAIEQDADMVIFPFRPGYYDNNAPEPELCELHIAKFRNGKVGILKSIFQMQFQKLVEYSKDPF